MHVVQNCPVVPDVSVIVPCYNATATIPATLASLQAQTHTHWEAVAVDDASTDDTPESLDAAARQDSRLRILRVPHGGVAAARNAGLSAARAPHVLFLDSDDVLRPDALAILLHMAKAAPRNAILAGGYELLDEAGSPLGVYHFPPNNAFTVESLLGGNSLPPTTLVPRSALGSVAFRTDLPTCEDWDLWLRLAQQRVPRIAIPRIVYGFRLRRGSLTHGADRLHGAGRQVLDQWRRLVADRYVVQNAYHQLAWHCGAVALASGAPDALAQYLYELPPLPITPVFEEYIASCVHSAFQFVRGAEGQTWRTHGAHWRREAQAWLRHTPAKARAEAILSHEPTFAVDPTTRFSAACEFLWQTGAKRIVVYGLGLNGRVFLELLRSNGLSNTATVCIADDFATADQLAEFEQPIDDPRRWHTWPEQTAVIVTPNEYEEIAATLMRAGGREGIEFILLPNCGATRTKSRLAAAHA